MCQCVTPQKEVVMCELQSGQYFGDLPMLFHDQHFVSVRAKTYVEVRLVWVS